MRIWTRTGLLAGAVAIAVAVATPAFAAGTTWQVDPSPQPAGSSTTGLSGVFAASSHEAWAVGSTRTAASGDGFGTLIEEWNGTSWSVVPGVSTSPSASSLGGVSGTGPDDVWAVGSQPGGSLFEHWNGTAWSEVAAPANQPTGSVGVVSADSADDAWAGGAAEKVNDPHDAGDTALLEHWNGTAWSVVPGAVDTTGTPLSSSIAQVSADSPTDAWALATMQQGRGSKNEIEHWNGTAWSTVPVPVSTVTAISALSPDDVWAVAQKGVILNWNGTQWTEIANPASGGDENFAAVDALSANDVWAISLDGTVTEQWNGAEWNSVPTATALPDGFRVAGGSQASGGALSGLSGGPLFAVGGDSSNQSTILQQPQP